MAFDLPPDLLDTTTLISLSATIVLLSAACTYINLIENEPANVTSGISMADNINHRYPLLSPPHSHDAHLSSNPLPLARLGRPDPLYIRGIVPLQLLLYINRI